MLTRLFSRRTIHVALQEAQIAKKTKNRELLVLGDTKKKKKKKKSQREREKEKEVKYGCGPSAWRQR